MSSIEIPFYPFKLQQDILNHPARYKVLRSGRRFGKSKLAQYMILMNAIKVPYSDNLYIGITNKQVKDIAFNPMTVGERGEPPIVPPELIQKISRKPGDLYIELISGGKISYRSAESGDAVARGLKLDFVVLDEIDFFRNGKYIWESVIRPAMMDNPNSKCLFISSPEREGGIISELFEKYKDGTNSQSWQATSIDNPYLTKGELDEIKKDITDEVTYKREILGLPVGYSGQCYSKFNHLKYVIPEAEMPKIQQYYKHFSGLDYGADHPTGILNAFLNEHGKLYIFDEFYERDAMMLEISNYIERNSKGWKKPILWIDPSARGLSNEISRAGIAAVEAAKNDVRLGIQKVNEMLANDKLYISSKCVNLIEEINNYVWDVTRGGKKKDKPKKINDDLCDALRYLCLSLSMSDYSSPPIKTFSANSVGRAMKDFEEERRFGGIIHTVKNFIKKPT